MKKWIVFVLCGVSVAVLSTTLWSQTVNWHSCYLSRAPSGACHHLYPADELGRENGEIIGTCTNFWQGSASGIMAWDCSVAASAALHGDYSNEFMQPGWIYFYGDLFVFGSDVNEGYVKKFCNGTVLENPDFGIDDC